MRGLMAELAAKNKSKDVNSTPKPTKEKERVNPPGPPKAFFQEMIKDLERKGELKSAENKIIGEVRIATLAGGARPPPPPPPPPGGLLPKPPALKEKVPKQSKALPPSSTKGLPPPPSKGPTKGPPPPTIKGIPPAPSKGLLPPPSKGPTKGPPPPTIKGIPPAPSKGLLPPPSKGPTKGPPPPTIKGPTKGPPPPTNKGPTKGPPPPTTKGIPPAPSKGLPPPPEPSKKNVSNANKIGDLSKSKVEEDLKATNSVTDRMLKQLETPQILNTTSGKMSKRKQATLNGQPPPPPPPPPPKLLQPIPKPQNPKPKTPPKPQSVSPPPKEREVRKEKQINKKSGGMSLQEELALKLKERAKKLEERYSPSPNKSPPKDAETLIVKNEVVIKNKVMGDLVAGDSQNHPDKIVKSPIVNKEDVIDEVATVGTIQSIQSIANIANIENIGNSPGVNIGEQLFVVEDVVEEPPEEEHKEIVPPLLEHPPNPPIPMTQEETQTETETKKLPANENHHIHQITEKIIEQTEENESNSLTKLPLMPPPFAHLIPQILHHRNVKTGLVSGTLDLIDENVAYLLENQLPTPPTRISLTPKYVSVQNKKRKHGAKVIYIYMYILFISLIIYIKVFKFPNGYSYKRTFIIIPSLVLQYINNQYSFKYILLKHL